MQLTIIASQVLDAEGRQLDGQNEGRPGDNGVVTLTSTRVISLARALPSARPSAVSAQAFDALISSGHFAGLSSHHQSRSNGLRSGQIRSSVSPS
jgi:hypothetical protein